MHISMDVSLDPTLGCGQAHRWRKTDSGWQGVLGKEIITLMQSEDGFECIGTCDHDKMLNYFRHDDDLKKIIDSVSSADTYMAKLCIACPGLRILRQDRWECLATYLLATNANVGRISKMVESVCEKFGDDLGTRHAFPTPGQILDNCECIGECRLGFRERRFLELADKMENGTVDLDYIGNLEYEGCRTELMKISGVGPKVADCVSLFAFDHLEAFPVDARISKSMKEIYGVEGTYNKVAGHGRKIFGEFAGYAQEFLYHRDYISI